MSSISSWLWLGREHLHAELPRLRIGGDVAALLAVLLPVRVAERERAPDGVLPGRVVAEVVAAPAAVVEVPAEEVKVAAAPAGE